MAIGLIPCLIFINFLLFKFGIEYLPIVLYLLAFGMGVYSIFIGYCILRYIRMSINITNKKIQNKIMEHFRENPKRSFDICDIAKTLRITHRRAKDYLEFLAYRKEYLYAIQTTQFDLFCLNINAEVN